MNGGRAGLGIDLAVLALARCGSDRCGVCQRAACRGRPCAACARARGAAGEVSNIRERLCQAVSSVCLLSRSRNGPGYRYMLRHEPSISSLEGYS
eukprot:1123093-Prymnesium_polylepis.2